jgi:ATP-binding cassette, subfamily B, bacterial CvaB/MchF/RaxB
MSYLLDLRLVARRRVKPVCQTEASECGLACLAMIANYHRLKIDLASLRQVLQPPPRGASLRWIMAAADQIGLVPRALKVPLNELKYLQTPAILHWNMNHFVVLEQVKRGKALIHNTDGRSKWYRLEDVSKSFTGVALELEPGNQFRPAELRNRLKLSQLWQRITGLKRAILQTLALSLVMQAFVLASPFYMQVAVDNALPALDGDLLTVLAIGFALLTLISVSASLMRSFVLLTASTSVSYGVAANIARKLFRLPAQWFERRDIGDILSRFQSIEPIKHALTRRDRCSPSRRDTRVLLPSPAFSL